MLAAAVGIEPRMEGDVRRIVEGNERLRVIPEELRARQDAFAVLIHEGLGLEVEGELFKAVVRIRGGATSARSGSLWLKHICSIEHISRFRANSYSAVRIQKYAGSFPRFHLMLQPMLGVCWGFTGWSASTASRAARMSAPLSAPPPGRSGPRPGRELSSCPR